ncbi:uncharacterized protein A4U43_C03F17110 [Asparagus officinalis]|uniref:Uncharacterized protein n=1 Tax=Asparagus officinalis TaxID=4686 RepID=A0A5P1FBP8_ASPOF|nr:uncharacterized protein A4U43_C03F17110 [Asparagus officinalis]
MSIEKNNVAKGDVEAEMRIEKNNVAKGDVEAEAEAEENNVAKAWSPAGSNMDGPYSFLSLLLMSRILLYDLCVLLRL